MRRGLTEEDDLAKLRERLRLLPTDLKTYFQDTLDANDDAYHTEVARVLLVAGYVAEPLPAGPLHFVDAERRDPDFVLRHAIIPVHRDVLLQWQVKIADRVSSWCPDLLVVKQPLADAKVHFLHRTVLDFLRVPDV